MMPLYCDWLMIPENKTKLIKKQKVAKRKYFLLCWTLLNKKVGKGNRLPCRLPVFIVYTRQNTNVSVMRVMHTFKVEENTCKFPASNDYYTPIFLLIKAIGLLVTWVLRWALRSGQQISSQTSQQIEEKPTKLYNNNVPAAMYSPLQKKRFLLEWINLTCYDQFKPSENGSKSKIFLWCFSLSF